MYPVATGADCSLTESALDLRLPLSYRKFVTAFSNGAYLYTLQEVSSVGNENRQIGAIQNVIPSVIGSNSEERISYYDGGSTRLANLIPFSLDSNANAWCFIVEPGSEEEPPVAYFETSNRKLYGELPSFVAWLEVLIENEDEVIRSLYDEDFINDELGLG
ncbi:MAG TPA: SMI1/KNR4 family protein [Capsulimonadaceae bacterium]|nr:SMI1/KNR4 family protein [Capsulimonadaceae bacterium]